MRSSKILLFVLLSAVPCAAQFSHPPIRSGAANPAKCSAAAGIGETKWFYNTTTRRFNYCSATDTWTAVGPAVAPGGANTQVQFNDSAAFGGDAGLVFIKASGNLTATGTLTGATVATSGGGAPSIGIQVANEGATGTTLNYLAKYTLTTAILATTSDAAVPVFIVTAGAGITGSATLAVAGQALCAFDGATTAGNFVQLSLTVGGKCHDVGASSPLSGWVVGSVLSTNGGAGTYTVALPQGFPAGTFHDVLICDPGQTLAAVCGTWTNLPAAFTVDSISARTNIDLAGFSQFRLLARYTVAAVTGDLAIQCDTDIAFGSPATLGQLDNPVATGSGWNLGAWTAIPAGECKTSGGVWLRVGMVNGNTTEDPVAAIARLQFR